MTPTATGPFARSAGYQSAATQPTSLAALRRSAQRWLLLSLLSFVACAFLNCLGLIGAGLCFLAIQACDQCEPADAAAKLRWAKIITSVGTGLSLIALVVSAWALLAQTAS